jgi:ankyrin repeat protein
MVASMKGYTDTVKEIITHKNVNVNAKDYYGNTALIYAAKDGYADIVKILISAGANPNDVANYGDDYTKPALMLAVEKGNVDTVKALLAGGANTEARFTRDHNQTILGRAVLFGHIEVIKVLLANGAKINAKDGNKCTALDEAQGFRSDPEIRKLLKASGGKCGCVGICN